MNTILDTQIYELELLDRWVEEYSVNTIVENFLEQVDTNGWDNWLLKEIIYFWSDTNAAVLRGESFYTTANVVDWHEVTKKGGTFKYHEIKNN